MSDKDQTQVSTATDAGDAGYNKALKNRHIQMIAIGGSIGTGLFLGAGGRLAQGGPALAFAYAVCGVFAFLMVRALGELAVRRPSSGAFVSYAREFLGEKGAFITGWFFFLDWAVTVTDGALERLTRDELMGLIAHECSHLKEGDTALNMRLMGMVAGLEMVWDFGRSLIPELEADDERRNEDWRWQLRTFQTPLAAFGLVFGPIIMAVGWLGWLAGHILQAAVSREREYLADARAVQWTRQADGLGRTLRKILTQQQEAAAQRPLARPLLRLSRASHLFLVADDGQWPTPENPGRLGRFLATHPPLPERIRRIYGRPRSPLPLPLIDQRTGEPVIELPPHAW